MAKQGSVVITGKLVEIGELVMFGQKNWGKVPFVVKFSPDSTRDWEEEVQFELTKPGEGSNQEDKSKLLRLAGANVGDKVEVRFDICGRRNQNDQRVWNALKAWAVKVIEPEQPQQSVDDNAGTHEVKPVDMDNIPF
jgi:hypothetical protein